MLARILVHSSAQRRFSSASPSHLDIAPSTVKWALRNLILSPRIIVVIYYLMYIMKCFFWVYGEALSIPKAAFSTIQM